MFSSSPLIIIWSILPSATAPSMEMVPSAFTNISLSCSAHAGSVILIKESPTEITLSTPPFLINNLLSTNPSTHSSETFVLTYAQFLFSEINKTSWFLSKSLMISEFLLASKYNLVLLDKIWP